MQEIKDVRRYFKAYQLFRLFVQGKKTNFIQCHEMVEVKFKVQRFHNSNVRQQLNPTQIIR